MPINVDGSGNVPNKRGGISSKFREWLSKQDQALRISAFTAARQELPPVADEKQTYRSQDVYNNNAKTPPPPMDENDVPNGQPANVKEDFSQYEGETYIDAMTGKVHDAATLEETGNEIVYDSQGRIIDFGTGARQRAKTDAMRQEIYQAAEAAETAEKENGTGASQRSEIDAMWQRIYQAAEAAENPQE